jgi:hypothetical protein
VDWAASKAANDAPAGPNPGFVTAVIESPPLTIQGAGIREISDDRVIPERHGRLSHTALTNQYGIRFLTPSGGKWIMRAPAFASPVSCFYLQLIAATIALAGCGTTQEVYRDEEFQPQTPFSANIQRPSKVVCWSVKRAFLSQGYMLERAADSATLTGIKDYPTDKETTVTLRLQTTCAENNDGSSTVFATASRDVSKVQQEKQHRSAGIGWFTVTVPSGSAETLRLIKRETVRDPDFYQRFYNLVKTFAEEDDKRPTGTSAR